MKKIMIGKQQKSNTNQEQFLLYLPSKINNTPYVIYPVINQTFIFYKQIPKQNLIYHIDEDTKIISTFNLNNYHIIKILMLSPHIVTIFSIDPNQMINQRNKIKINQWNLYDHTSTNQRYLIQPVFMGPLSLCYSNTLAEQNLLTNPMENFKIKIYCFLQTQTYCIIQRNKQTTISYFRHPTMTKNDCQFEQIYLFQQFQSFSKINNHSKIGLFTSIGLFQFSFCTIQLNKNPNQLGTILTKYKFDLQKIFDTATHEGWILKVIDIWEIRNNEFFLKIMRIRMPQVKYSGYIVQAVGDSLDKQLILKKQISNCQGDFIANFCTPYQLNYNYQKDRYGITKNNEDKTVYFINNISYQILWKQIQWRIPPKIHDKNLKMIPKSKQISKLCYPQYNKKLKFAYHQVQPELEKISLKCHLQQLPNYQIIQSFILTSLTQNIDQDLIYQVLQLIKLQNSIDKDIKQ